MRSARLSLLALAAICVLPAWIQAQEKHADHEHALGSVNFRNSGNKAAQAAFQRGVALLHNFEYGDAADAFREAQRIDKTLAAAYWLEALTYSHVVWGEEDVAKSRAALARLGATPAERLAQAKTPAERSFGAAVEAFYQDGPLNVRAKAYADTLRALAAADTNDLEIAAFTAHALMAQFFTARPQDRGELAGQSRAYAMRVFQKNPQHPGAAHYLTHVADMDPRSASQQLEAARAYDKIAPASEHALHMPSHVYLPLGLWPEVSRANERSWAASRAEVIRSKSPATDNSWHSLEWLQYSYLQQGRFAEARALIDTARMILKGATFRDEEPDPRFAVSQLIFSYSMDTGEWDGFGPIPDGEAILQLNTPTPRAQSFAAIAAYQSAVRSLMTGVNDGSPARIQARFNSIADTAQSPLRKAALQRYANQIEAIAALKSNNIDRAIELLRPIAAAEAQGASTPPTSIPSYELLGQALLMKGDKQAAAEAFQRALEARPNRRVALEGMKKAK